MKDRHVPAILLVRWIDELILLSDLVEVLYRSVSYTRETQGGGERDKRTCVGDDILAKIIRDRLTDLFVEIEVVQSLPVTGRACGRPGSPEVNDGHLDDKV